MDATRREPRARWRGIADRLKGNPNVLRLADRLGRGKGRMRFLDCFVKVPVAPEVPDLAGWETRTLSVVWMGHASLMIRMGGLTIFTDPVFSKRVGVGLGVATGGPQRLVGLPVPLADMPTPDVVLVSHAHFDHLDRPTLARLPKSAHVVTSDRNADLVGDYGYRGITELKVGASHVIGKLSITAIPVKHWGARVIHDSHRGYSGFLLETARHRVLFGADTAYQDYWKAFAPVDLCAVGIGAYNPWVAAHATPEQGVAMADHCGAKAIGPIHHSTFKLSHEPMSEPIHRFKAIVPESRTAWTQVGGTWNAPD